MREEEEADGREGSSNAHWLRIDYGSVIVHVMAQPERDFYQLERLGPTRRAAPTAIERASRR